MPTVNNDERKRARTGRQVLVIQNKSKEDWSQTICEGKEHSHSVRARELGCDGKKRNRVEGFPAKALRGRHDAALQVRGLRHGHGHALRSVGAAGC